MGVVLGWGWCWGGGGSDGGMSVRVLERKGCGLEEVWMEWV